jgi:hypothetical protein
MLPTMDAEHLRPLLIAVAILAFGLFQRIRGAKRRAAQRGTGDE